MAAGCNSTASQSTLTEGMLTGGSGDTTQGSSGAGSTGAAESTGTGAGESGTTSGGDTSDSGTAGDGLAYLEVTPRNTVLELDLNTASSQPFTLTGWTTDGSSVDLTAAATWSHSNPELGTMTSSTLDVPGFATTQIGSTIVTAEYGGLTGQAQVTVAAYRQTGDQVDFLFLLPYEDPAGPQDKPLTFTTDVKSMDVFISMDTTGSMGNPIGNLQAALTNTVIPGIRAAVPDTQFGVGAFEDFPIDPFGSNDCLSPEEPDQPFELLQPITSVVAQIEAGMAALLHNGRPTGCGGDRPEATLEALYQIATGAGLTGPAPTLVPAHQVGVGGVEFREGSLPVIVSVTDALAHNPGNMLCDTFATDYETNAAVLAVAHTREQTYAALHDICARVVTVAVNNVGNCGAYADGFDFAEHTGTMIPPEAWDLAAGGRPAGCGANQCCTDRNGGGFAPNGDGLCPLVYQADVQGNGVGSGVTDGVSMLARYAPFTVTTDRSGPTTDIDGNALPAPHTTADFITAVTPVSHGSVPLPGVPDPTLTETTFEGVIPNTDVTFSVTAYNDFVVATDAPQVFEATIRVLADGCSDLDERTVFIVVPPANLPPPG